MSPRRGSKRANRKDMAKWRGATTIGIGRNICVVCDKTAYLCGALWATTIHRGTGKTTRIWQGGRAGARPSRADATGRVPPVRTRRGASLPCGRAGARPSHADAQERVPPMRTRRSASLPCGRDGARPSLMVWNRQRCVLQSRSSATTPWQTPQTRRQSPSCRTFQILANARST